MLADVGTVVDLDHIGVAVGDLDAAGTAYRRLGFRLTEKSEHVTPGPGGSLVPAGTGNHCIILSRGYVELIAVTRPGYAGRLLNALAHHEGVHLICVGAPSALDAERLFARTTGKPATARMVKRPFTESGRDFVAGFAIVDLPASSEMPGINLFAIEHLTRDVIWQPQLCQHDNGAVALCSVTIGATDAEAYRLHLAGLLDALPAGGAVPLAEGAIAVASPAELARRFPGAPLPSPPSAVAFSVAVRDLAETAAWLASQNVICACAADRIWVDPGFAHGAIIEFVPAAA